MNETFGWSAADLLLCEVARRLRAVWPEPNVLARVSADSFALVLTGIVAQDTEDLRQELESSVNSVFTVPFFVDKAEIRIAVTVGVAASPIDGATADELFRNAEAAQKVAQQDGEHILFYSREMNSEVQDSLLLETRLRRALESERFELHYQPKRATASGRISGVEALLRWRDGEYVPPARFIPILQEQRDDSSGGRMGHEARSRGCEPMGPGGGPAVAHRSAECLSHTLCDSATSCTESSRQWKQFQSYMGGSISRSRRARSPRISRKT